MKPVRSWIARGPKRALVIGKALFLAGAVLVLAAVFGRAGLLAVNGERADAGLPALRTLAEAFPQYPAWIVPEGAVGYAVAAVLVLAGMVLVVEAEKAGSEGRARGGKWW